jgi:hypothetical protein
MKGLESAAVELAVRADALRGLVSDVAPALTLRREYMELGAATDRLRSVVNGSEQVQG